MQRKQPPSLDLQANEFPRQGSRLLRIGAVFIFTHTASDLEAVSHPVSVYYHNTK